MTLLAATMMALSTLAPTPALAEATQAAACPGGSNIVPAEYAGWDSARSLATETDGQNSTGASFVTGEAIDMALHPLVEVSYAGTPRLDDETAFGGIARLTIGEAGQYRIALGDRVWGDLVRDGQAVATTSFGHGPECTPIRKILDFVLTPGDYILELSGSAKDTIRVMALPITE